MGNPQIKSNTQRADRGALQWKHPDFADLHHCHEHMQTVFELCASCRQCLSLCNTFPSLFDLVDESESGEVSDIPKSEYLKLADQCHLCDQCFSSTCPYGSPHPQALDFPRTMLRAKAVKFQQGLGPKPLFQGQSHPFRGVSGIPVLAALLNGLGRSRLVRKGLRRATGLDPQAFLPPLAMRRFVHMAEADGVVDAQPNPVGKVAVLAGCYLNYHEPSPGVDLLRVLQHNGVACTVPVLTACCGRSHWERGDLQGLAETAKASLPTLVDLLDQGYSIVSLDPGCTRMFTIELPALFPDDPDIERVSLACWNASDYLLALHRRKHLKTDFKQSVGRVNFYRVPQGLHGKEKSAEALLKLLPGLQLNVVEGSVWPAGNWGATLEHHPVAMKLARGLLKDMAAESPDYLSAECQLTGRQMAHGIESLGFAQSPEKRPDVAHPVTLMRLAYGL